MMKRVFAIILVFAYLVVCCAGCAKEELSLTESDVGTIKAMLKTSLASLIESETKSYNQMHDYNFEVTVGSTTWKYPGKNGEGLKPEDWHFDEIEFMPTGYFYEDHIVLPFKCQLSIKFDGEGVREPGVVYMFLVLEGVKRSSGVINTESAYVNMAGMFTGTYNDYLKDVRNYVNRENTEEIPVPFGKIS